MSIGNDQIEPIATWQNQSSARHDGQPRLTRRSSPDQPQTREHQTTKRDQSHGQDDKSEQETVQW
jgi:hypothetical protein